MDGDTPPSDLRQVSIIGYGNQGRAHALNLRDSGIHVTVGQRFGGAGFEHAVSDGFAPRAIADAAAQADLIVTALPDATAPQIYDTDIAPHLSAGQTLGFLHGFNIHYRRILPPGDVDVILVAPKATGQRVRQAYLEGQVVPCAAAVEQDCRGQAWPTALAWAQGINRRAPWILKTTFTEETHTDLFGEQVSVVGGVTALMKAAFETLIDAGYNPQQAYFECVHEVKFVVDLIHQHGVCGMRRHISDTAAFGDVTRNQRLADAVKPIMRDILQQIRSGQFAREWSDDLQAGSPMFAHHLEQEQHSLLEQVGSEIRRRLDEG